MKKWKRRWPGLCIALALVCLLGTGFKAQAADKVWYAANYTDFFWSWVDIVFNYGGTGTIVLTGDIAKGDDTWDSDNQWEVTSGMNITIDLNGHTLSNHCGTFFAYAKSSMFFVDGGLLTIYSSNGTGKIDGRGLCYAQYGTNECGALIDVKSGCLRLGYDGSGTPQKGALQIGNVTNLCSYGGTDKTGGTVINIWSGVLFAYGTKFYNADGTALWGCHSGESRGSSTTYLTQCSSENVSGLWSSGDWKSSTSKIIINGGNYQIGRIYTAGVACSQYSTGNQITNCTIDGGNVTVEGNSNITMDTVTMTGGAISLTSNQNCTIKNVVGSGSNSISSLLKMRVAPTLSTVVTTIENVEFSNAFWGIKVESGICNISGTTLKNNVFIGLWVSGGTVNLSGGCVTENDYGMYSEAAGTLNIFDINCTDNVSYGLYNVSANGVNYTGGTMKNNGSYDIYQGGKSFTMSESASASGKGIFLVKGCTVQIATPLTVANGSIPLTLAEDNIAPGTVCIQNNFTAATEAMLQKFALQNTYTSTETEAVMSNGVSRRVAVLRVGNDVNGGNAAQIVLSEEYYVTCQSTIANAHLTYVMPETGIIYWKEDNAITTGGVMVYYDGRECKSLILQGWNKNVDGTGEGCEVGGTLTYNTAVSVRDYVIYPLWLGAGNLQINGNQQTTGENYTLEGFVSGQSLLPENTFTKVGTYTYTQKDGLTWKEEEVQADLGYSFQGWSLSDRAVYSDTEIYLPGDPVDITRVILEELTAGTEQMADNGYFDVTCYVVWDEFPVITATDKFFSKSDLEKGELTAENLLQSATATDREDKDEVSLTLKDFYPEEFSELTGDYSYGTVTYQCTDGVGNVSYRQIHVYITADGFFQGEYVEDNPRYTRFINKEYYLTKNEKKGGLLENSVWYQEDSYVQALQDAFDRIDKGTYVIRYTFDREDIIKSQQYVQQHGPGNETSQDNLANYITLFQSL